MTHYKVKYLHGGKQRGDWKLPSEITKSKSVIIFISTEFISTVENTPLFKN